MDARPEKFDLEFWKDIFKLLSRLAVLGAVLIGGSEGAAGLASSSLQVQEAKAGVNDAKSDTDTAYVEYEELARYHATQDARCDQALEMFARHRDDDHDWQHVLSACHSETPLHEHEEGP